MSSVSGVRAGEAPGGTLREKRLRLGADPTVRTPGSDVVGVVAGVSEVVEGELLEGAIADLQRLEFVGQIPRPVTPRAGDRRKVVGAGARTVCHTTASWAGRLSAPDGSIS